MSERKCVNCRHNIRITQDGYCKCECDIDGHRIGYVECFEHWCRHWAKDHKWDDVERGGADNG